MLSFQFDYIGVQCFLICVPVLASNKQWCSRRTLRGRSLQTNDSSRHNSWTKTTFKPNICLLSLILNSGFYFQHISATKWNTQSFWSQTVCNLNWIETDMWLCITFTMTTSPWKTILCERFWYENIRILRIYGLSSPWKTISPVNVTSAEVWKVTKFRWENLPRLRQVVAAMDLVDFLLMIAKVMMVTMQCILVKIWPLKRQYFYWGLKWWQDANL